MLCSLPAKLVAKVMRRKVADVLPLLAGSMQCGAVKGGGVEFPARSAKAFLRKARAERKSACILSGEIKGAFYSVLPETFLGLALAPKHRDALFDLLGGLGRRQAAHPRHGAGCAWPLGRFGA